jgi:rRNA processing protein Gar1
MNSNSNALKLLSIEYESDSSDENESKLIEDKSIAINNNESEDQINACVKITLNQLIQRVSNDLDIDSDNHSNQFSFDSQSFSTNRFFRSDSEINISSSSSTSSWTLTSDEDISDEELNQTNKSFNKSNDNKRRNFVKTKGELSIEELPPIEKLSIKVNVEELTQIGRVASIIDQLVIVQSFRSMPALDLDSVLFLKDGSALGSVFDLFGPVVEPRYAIRFNNNQQIVERNITPETPVYFAANYQKPVTGYVFAEQLRQMKGSDASWKHNNEPPDEVKEYSDDETERTDKLKQRAKGRRRFNAFNQIPNRNYSQRYSRNSPLELRVPPNTPNSPFIHYHQNHYQQYPHQFSQQNNWFSNSYH